MKINTTFKTVTALLVFCISGICSIHAAQTVHLTLEGASIGPIEGDSTISSLDRENTIECVAVNHETLVDRQTGNTALRDFRFIKRIDRSSPLLYQALDTKDELVVASFRFFRPVPGGSGSEEHYYTIELGGGKITSIRNWFPNVLDATANNYPHMEEVTITFTTMRIVYETGGVEYAIETEGTK
jgi:type VI secretion system secreted protein Hcp